MTDADGRFEVRGLVAGNYDIELFTEIPIDVYYEGNGTLPLEDTDLDDVVFRVVGQPWDDDDDDDDDDADAPPSADPLVPPARALGSVVDGAGKPVADAIVIVTGSGPPLHKVLELLRRSWDERSPVRSDAKGAFEAPLPAVDEQMAAMDEDGEDARPHLIAFAPGGAVGIAPLRPDGATELVVRPLAEVTVEVRDRRGRAVPHFGIDLDRGRPRPLYVHAPAGTFSIPGLLPGLHRLRIDTAEGDTGERFTVPGRGAPQRLRLEAKGKVRELHVYTHALDPLGRLAGCKVALRPIPGRRRAPVLVDEQGYVEFTDVPAGLTRLDLLPCVVGERRYPAQSLHLRLRPDRLKILSFGVAGVDAKLGRIGRLGYDLTPRRADIDPIRQPLRVRAVRPGGPAARAGLQVGDEIIRVGEHHVGGRRSYHYDVLTRVAPGARVVLGLADGRSVELVTE